MGNTRMNRRDLITGVGAAAAGYVAGGGANLDAAPLQAAAPLTTFQPARHPQDEWLDKIPGKHRVVLDATSAAGAGQGIGYAGNVFNANRTGYQIENNEMAVVLCLRHDATAFAYNNAMWAKYGAILAMAASFVPDSGAVPKSNPRNSGDRPALDNLAKRGAHFIVCGLATTFIAGQIVGPNGDTAAAYKELEANLIPNAHIMSAGVVGITRAQEYRYSLIHVG